MSDASEIMRRIDGAVCQNPVTNRNGLQERPFARLLEGVGLCPDLGGPVADMAALDLSPGADIIRIASGGRNAMSCQTDAQLNALWAEITRTARPGARVLFRTGGTDDMLPGRVSDELKSIWAYDLATSKAAFAQDRSASYGGAHLYRYHG